MSAPDLIAVMRFRDALPLHRQRWFDLLSDDDQRRLAECRS